MTRCFLPRLFVVALLFLAGSAHGQLLDRAHRRVINSNSRVNTRWGVWNDLKGVTTVPGGGHFHAEGQFPGVVAADFVFTSDVTLGEDMTEAHLQFRLSNEGRYGVLIAKGGVQVYKQVRRANLAVDDPDLSNDEKAVRADQLSLEVLVPLVPHPEKLSHRVQVVAIGPLLTVTVNDGAPITVRDTSLGVGRFGLYVTGKTAAASATFSRLTADAMVLEPSNFALLYNTLGYESTGPKRVLVRTLADLPPTWVKEAKFTVTPVGGRAALASGDMTYAKSLGMSTWAANFNLETPGVYVLNVNMLGYSSRDSGRFFDVKLVSSPFEIGPRLITRRMLKALALSNPEARRAADHDLSWHWTEKSGRFIVQNDGSIYAEGDAVYGGVLERTGSGYGIEKVAARTFTLSGDVAIDSGCDAQLQFQVTTTSRFAVTLQAGSAGGCVRGGPGAVSLHYEDRRPGSSSELKRATFEKPFELRRFYRIVVSVTGGVEGPTYADVEVDDVPMLTQVQVGSDAGHFAIKAWSSTARFDHLIAWKPGVDFVRRGGIRIPALWRGERMITCEDGPENLLTGDERRLICDPYFAQRHGFHDCNNYIGEGTSHGTFLAGLMDVWARRKGVLDETEVISLRRAVAGAAGYLEELQRAAGYTGEYAHEEPSRGARESVTGPANVWLGLFGDAALAAKGADLDHDGKLARAACVRVSRTVSWLLAEEARAVRLEPTRFPLGANGEAWYDRLKSLVYAQLAQCGSREGAAVLLPMPPEALLEHARQAAHLWIDRLKDHADSEPRETLNAIPWLSGIDEVLRFGPDPYLIAGLEALAWKLKLSTVDAEGFFIIPAGNADHWKDRTAVPASKPPLVPQKDTNPALTWYIVSHFASSATDAAILAHYTDSDDSRNRAAGNLGWILGLNPGIPSTKALNANTGGRPWTAAAFVSNLNIPSARGMEAFMTPATIHKYWLYWWEEGVRSVHRESWLMQPKNNHFITLLNGHMLWDGQWDYWNQGKLGWMSGETFLLHDGAFLKAAIAFEDAMAGDWPLPDAKVAPRWWNVDEVTFFDTTLDQRKQTGWGFEYINDVEFAQASRMSQELCGHLGYAGGRPTGHQIGELMGVICVPHTGTRAFDAEQASITPTGSQFTDINIVSWDEASRVASALCVASAGGFFTGHQIGELRGVICPGTNSATRFPASGIDTSSWQKAARTATNFCRDPARGYLGGFYDGDQGVVCLKPGG